MLDTTERLTSNEAGCLSNPSLVPEYWGMPRELLGFSRHWNSKEVVSKISKGTPQQQER